MRVAVIGAGPSGLTAAYQLAKAGVEVEVFEASLAVGGLSRSISLWGQTVDLGPHRYFSNDAQVNRLWLEVVERDYAMVDRRTRILDRDRFFDDSPLATNALANLGPVETCQCVLSYLRTKRESGALESGESAANFEQWGVQRFGRRLFETRFKTLSEKLWGIPGHQLDAEVAAQRIKTLSLGEAIKHTLRWGGQQTQSLGDRFAYPLSGTGLIYDRMADYLRGLGGQIHLGVPVRRLLRERDRIVGLELPDRSERRFQHVISTMPLSSLARGIADVPAEVTEAAGRLKFRNTILVYLQVAARDLFPDQWLTIHTEELLAGRVTNFRNWVPQLCGDSPDTILCLEYWCSAGDELWKQSDADLIRRAQAEMTSTGLLGGARITGGHAMRLERCFPVPEIGHQQPLQTITGFLQEFAGLSAVGGYGSCEYNDQERSLQLGMLAAENLLEHRQHQLWGTSVDTESCREAAMIDARGLVSLAV